MKRVLVVVVAVVAATGCIRRTPKYDPDDERVLSAKGRNVRLMKSDPPLECREIGPVSASVFGSMSLENTEEAKVVARNKAAAQGADYLRIDSMRINAIAGTAFHCGLPPVETPIANAPTDSDDEDKVLSAAGKRVRVMKSDPPFECRELGAVSATVAGSRSARNQEETMAIARNKAARMGADYFRVDGSQPNIVMGTAFRCAPPEKTTAAATSM